MDIKILSNNTFFYFKNILVDEEAGLYRFLFNHKNNTTMICIEIYEMKAFLDEITNDKYKLDETDYESNHISDYNSDKTNIIINLINDLIDNLAFYSLGYNTQIKNFTYTNIIYIINKISNAIIYHNYIQNNFQIKNKIKDKLYDILNNNKDNIVVETIYKKIWFLLNHLRSIEKINISKLINDEDLTFSLDDFIFDYYK